MIQNIDFVEYLDKDALRQEQLLKILMQEDKWYQLDDLANKLLWAKSTISKDVSCLNELLPHNWNVLSSKGRGIYLVKPADASFEDIVHLIRENSKSVKIIKAILYSKYNSILSMSQQLYIPYRAAEKIVKQLEQHLKLFDLTLCKRPLQIKGSEMFVRAFIIKFYLSIYGQKWPFLEYNQRLILNYIYLLEKQLDIVLFEKEKYFVAVCLCVTINRIKRRKHINIDQYDVKLLKNTTFHTGIEKIIPFIEKDHNIFINDKESIYLTIQFLGLNYSHINKNKSKQYVVEKIRTSTAYPYLKAHAFITSLEKNLDISLWNDDELLFQIVMSFRKIVNCFKILPREIILKHSVLVEEDSLIKRVKMRHEFVFNIIKTQCQLFFAEYNQEVPDKEVAIITLHVVANTIINSIKPLNVLLHVGENEGMYRYVYAWLKKNFQNQIEIFPFSEKKPLNNATNDNIDFVITNANLGTSSFCSIIKISEFPSNRDKQTIEKFIKCK
ncbi:helix-turn-helix domain-containing protein [Bacillus thuringiensis]|nr:helix-turn-helix domain-containing protein [Bacillus thuringiensis]